MGGRELRRNTVLTLDKSVQVILGSIGSDVRYDLETKEISSKGFFLETKQPRRFPFTMSSIIEVWIEIGSGSLVFFNGKVSKVVDPESSETQQNEKPGIAVRIIQIEPDEEKRLNEFINYRLDLLDPPATDSNQTAPPPPAVKGAA